jgi:hypothetical protein
VWLCKNPSSSLPGGSLDKHERVVVKLPFDPPGTFNYEEDILRQLRHVPNVAQLLDVVHFTPDDRPARLGLVLPYYDTGGIPLHRSPYLLWSPTYPWLGLMARAGVVFASGDLSLGQHASDQLFADYTRQLLQVRSCPFPSGYHTMTMMRMTCHVVRRASAGHQGHTPARSNPS